MRLSGVAERENIKSYGKCQVKEKDSSAFNLAVASVVCGVTGYFLIFPSVAGIVLGFMALHKIRKSVEPLKGRKLAIIGIIVSGITTAFWLILFPVVCILWGFAP
jgi:uncharacterized membrane protein